MSYPAIIVIRNDGTTSTAEVTRAAMQKNVFTGKDELVFAPAEEIADLNSPEFQKVLGDATAKLQSDAIALRAQLSKVTAERDSAVALGTETIRERDELRQRVDTLVPDLAAANQRVIDTDAARAAIEAQLAQSVAEANDLITMARQQAEEAIAAAKQEAAAQVAGAKAETEEIRASIASMQTLLTNAENAKARALAENSQLRVEVMSTREQRGLLEGRVQRLIKQLADAGMAPIGGTEIPQVVETPLADLAPAADETPAADGQEA